MNVDGHRRIFILAGEPSGDALAARLLSGLKEKAPDVEFFGVGGPLMAAEGLESLFSHGRTQRDGPVRGFPPVADALETH